MSTESSVFPLSLSERLVFAVFVVCAIVVLLVFPGVLTLVSLALSLLVIWLLWRLVQAAERIADATEELAVDD